MASKSFKERFYSNKKENNTFIGGVAALIPDAATMASVLNNVGEPIATTDIKNYRIEDNDVSFRIDKNFRLEATAFGANAMNRATAIKYLFDYKGKASRVGVSGLSAGNVIDTIKEFIYLPNASLSQSSFERNNNSVIAVPKNAPLVGDVGNNQVFLNSNNNVGFFNAANETNNGGGVEGDVAELIANGGEAIYVANTTKPPRITDLDIVNEGATYLEISFLFPEHVNEYRYFIAIVNEAKLVFFKNTSSTFIPNLTAGVKSVRLIAIDQYFNVSQLSNKIYGTPTGQIAAAALYANASGYYKMNETTGAVIDSSPNGVNGSIVGPVTRDGEWYDYGTGGGYGLLPDNDGFSFTDGSGNLLNFTILTTVIFDGFNNSNRAWLVSKREFVTAGVQEWQLAVNNDELLFLIFDDINNNLRLPTPFVPNIGQEYNIGTGFYNGYFWLGIDGVILTVLELTAGTTFFNGTSPVKLGNETFTANLNLVGRQKNTGIFKGNNFTAGDFSDVYNLGNGVDYP